MRSQSFISAAAALSLLGAAALLGATSPGRAAPARPLAVEPPASATSRAHGGCGAATVIKPNYQMSASAARAMNAAWRRCDPRAPITRS